MLPEIRGLWIGQLSKMERLCIKSFQYHGHKFVLYVYDDVGVVPFGTEVRDACNIISRSELAHFVKRGSLAGFSDLFRWELLRVQGGYWVDMDMVCLAPFDFIEEVIFGYQQDNIPAQGVLRFPENHVAVVEMLDRSMNPNKFRPEDSVRRKIKKILRKILGNSRAWIDWAEGGGPIGFRYTVERHKLWMYGKAYTVFYPVHNTHFWSIFDATFANDESFFSETRAIHLWNEVGRRYFNLDKNGSFHADSLIERLKRMHGV